MTVINDPARPGAECPASLEMPVSAADAVSHLAEVYRDYPGLRALILRRVRDPELAADILQDAAVTTLEKLRSGHIHDAQHLGGYLYRVALNHLRNHRRKDRSLLSDSFGLDQLPNTEYDPEWECVGRPQWTAAVRRAIDEMPVARDKELLVRFYLHEESKEQICRELQLSDEHFNRVIFRARNRFRGLLEDRGWKADLLAIAFLALCISGSIRAVIPRLL
jgi:RNA polymerase sigma-70 factor, ECF subfamily